MLKKIVKVFFILLTGLIVTACSSGGEKVDEKTAKKYEAKAEDVVKNLNHQEYSKMIAQFDSKMKKSLTEEKLKELEPTIAEAGAYKSITKSSVEKIDEMYKVVLVTKYENAKLTYTISFNDKDQLSGLYVK